MRLLVVLASPAQDLYAERFYKRYAKAGAAVHISIQKPADESATPSSSVALLPRGSKELIVLVCMTMGLVMYGLMQGWWGDSSMTLWAVVATVLAMGSFLVMALVQRRDVLLWQCVAGGTALVLVLNLSVWWLSGAERKPSSTWAYWQVMLAGVLFIALAWLQAVLQSRSLRAVRYSSLFVQAWHNTMVVGMVAQFVGLCWLVLALWGGLFMLVKVDFFAQSFAQPLFICIATGLMAGVGVVLARGQPRALQLQLQLVLALFRVLLPLLALVVVLFIVTLPFTGVQPLWDTRKAAVLLVVVQLCVLLFVNAVFQDGLQEAAPYPRPLAALVHTALILLPALGVLAVWAVVLRVQQYGWTYDRVWALVVTALLLIYSLGYAWHAVQRDRFLWLQGLGRFNAGMSWLVMAVVVVLNTPLLDVYRLSAHSQLQHMQQPGAVWNVTQLQSLRFDHGRHGLPALQALAQDPRAQEPAVKAAMQEALAASKKVHIAQAERPTAKKIPAREALQLAQGHSSPPNDWWQSLEDGALRHRLHSCRSQPLTPADSCVVLQLPLSHSDQPLPVVCKVHEYSPSCEVFERDAQQLWQQVGSLSWGGVPTEQRPALAQAIREGRLQVQPSRWKDVAVPGVDVKTGQVR